MYTNKNFKTYSFLTSFSHNDWDVLISSQFDRHKIINPEHNSTKCLMYKGWVGTWEKCMFV